MTRDMRIKHNRLLTKWKLPSWRYQGNSLAQLEYRLRTKWYVRN